MQYQVPQFIETEDKIVGPFSLRQFAYVGAAGIVAGIAYFLVQTWLFVIIAIVTIGGSLALSFVKINGRPLIKVALSAFSFYWKPQLYVWKPVDAIIQPQRPAPKTVRMAEPTEEATPGGSLHRIVAQRQSAPAQPVVRELPPVEKIASGDSLHKSWESLQTGTPPAESGRTISDRQFIEKKMAERYQIFQRLSGARDAARRVDYR
ncbi:MAG TPA: PrgI family protein [Candidatus Paceibacterota bacterium]|nr:PrgI family protein [Candidatus Paceibacterota bacterium]